MNHQELIEKYDTLCATKKGLQSEKVNNMNEKKSKRQTIRKQKSEMEIYVIIQKQQLKQKQDKLNEGQNAQGVLAFKMRFMIKDQSKKIEFRQRKLEWATLRVEMKQLTERNKQIQEQLKQINMQIREIKPQLKEAKLALKSLLKQEKINKNKPAIIECKQLIQQMKQVVDKYSNKKKKIVITQEQYLSEVKNQILNYKGGIANQIYKYHSVMINKQLTFLKNFCFQQQQAKDDTVKFLREQKIPHVYIDDVDRSLSNPEQLKGVLSFYPVLNAKTIKLIKTNKNVARIIGSSLQYDLRSKQDSFEIFETALKMENPPKKIKYSLDQDLIDFGIGIFWVKNYEYITGIQFNNSNFRNINVYHCESFEFPIEIQQELKQILKQQCDSFTASITRINNNQQN